MLRTGLTKFKLPATPETDLSPVSLNPHYVTTGTTKATLRRGKKKHHPSPYLGRGNSKAASDKLSRRD